MAVFIFVKIPEFCIFVPHFLPNPNGGLLSAMMLFPFYANAISVMPVGCSLCTGMETDAGNNSGTGCASTQYVCNNQLRYLDCTSCKSGYMRVEHVLSDTCSYWSCQYGCAAGEYYTVSGCYDWPYPGTSASGTSSITGCYIPANQLTSSDSAGSWTCTSAAYYQN